MRSTDTRKADMPIEADKSFTKEQAAFDARALLLDEYSGVMSTHSNDVPGYPFGSVMPYCLDGEGRPAILIANIAQHAKNIKQNPKVSLIVRQSNIDDVHLGGRITWIGDAQLIEDSEEEALIAERYFSYFPASRSYRTIKGDQANHNFRFYRINFVRGRFIGGFGNIFWVKPALFLKKNPFYGDVEQAMVKHMNEDHLDAMLKYCKVSNIELPEGIQPKMAGLNSEGMHLRIGRKIVFIRFPKEAYEAMAVRQQLVAMAKAA